MPVIVGSLNEISRSTVSCETKAFSRLYWAETKNIDLPTMVGATANFDPTDAQLKLFAMLNGGVFKKIDFDRSSATFRSEYTEETGKYATTITLSKKEVSNSLVQKLFKASKVCNITVVCILEDDTKVTAGIDYDGFELFAYDPKFKVRNHTLDLGQRGTGDAVGRNDWTISGSSEHHPLFYKGTEAQIPV